jgi:hypothetical protein
VNYKLNEDKEAGTNKGGLTVGKRAISIKWGGTGSFQYNGDYQKVEVKAVVNDRIDSPVDPDDLVYKDNVKVNAGTYKALVSLTGEAAEKYTIVDGSDEFSWEITKRPAKIYANNSTIVYREAPKANGYYVDNKNLVVNKETGKLDTIGDVSFNYSYNVNDKPGTYNIMPYVRNLNPNYTVAGYGYGTLTVNNKVYELLAQGKASGSNGIRISWNNVSDAASYDVYLARCNTKSKTYSYKRIATVKGTNYRAKGLKKKTCHKFYVVARDANGSSIARSNTAHAATGNVNGKYTNARSLKLNTYSVSLQVGGTAKVTGTLTKVKSGKKLLDRGHGAKLRYFSNNPSVAEVSSTGVITAISKGWCKVYVQSLNGIWKEVQVNVN